MTNEIKLSKINEILSDLGRLSVKYKKISSDQSSNYHEEKNMGDYGIKVEIFDIGEPNVFLKVAYHSDSYGGNELVASVQFVTAVEKVVTGYEPIKE